MAKKTDKKSGDVPAAGGGKSQALQLAVDQIEKQFGKGSIMRLGENHTADIETTPTGSISLDLALGGGIPRGRIIEIYGPESSGKTTVCLHAVAEVQKSGGTAAYVDAEHALDPAYAKKIGVDTNNLLLSQPDSGEQALEVVEALVRSNAVDIIVVDSVAALVPQAEIEGDMGDAHMGLQARLMSQALRKLTGVISRTKCTVVFVNQLRMKIGVMFGNPETTTGGQALKFYSSVRMDIRRISQIKQADAVIGNHVRIKVVKNKVAPPFREAEFDIMYNQGISREGDVIDLAAAHEVVQKSGAWYEYKGEKIAQGREAAKKYLHDNPKVLEEVAKATKEAATAE
jgi:recombination protein RecA